MDFSKITSLAENAAASLGKDEAAPAGDNKEQQKAAAPATSSSGGWGNVGKEAKEAFTEYQSKGTIDYKELGSVAKDAATAYNAETNKDDYAAIGKSIASGMFGSGAGGKPAAAPAAEAKPEEKK